MVDRSWDKDLEDMGSKCCLPPPLMDVAQVSQGLLISFVLPGFRQSLGVEGVDGEHQRLEAASWAPDRFLESLQPLASIVISPTSSFDLLASLM